MVEKTISLMGGEIYYYLATKTEEKTKEILIFLINETKKYVNIFNFFDEKSLLSLLNTKKKCKYQKELAFLLEESIVLYKESKSKFNIFLGKETTKRKENKVQEIISNKSLSVNKLITISDKTINITNNSFTIDLGGIAKGYILDLVLEKTIKKYSKEIIDILIDARGDIICYGKNNKKIEVENPFDEKSSFEEISLKTGSIITSGHNKQYFKKGSHILGKESEVLTLTLKSEKEKTYFLDALGTWFIQLNSEEILTKIEFEDKYKEIECIIILKNGKVLRSSFW